MYDFYLQQCFIEKTFVFQNVKVIELPLEKMRGRERQTEI